MATITIVQRAIFNRTPLVLSPFNTVFHTWRNTEAELLCDRLAIMDNGKIITIDTPHNLIQQLLARGFKKKQVVEQANLEDVFIDLTGKAIRD